MSSCNCKEIMPNLPECKEVNTIISRIVFNPQTGEVFDEHGIIGYGIEDNGILKISRTKPKPECQP